MNSLIARSGLAVVVAAITLFVSSCAAEAPAGGTQPSESAQDAATEHSGDSDTGQAADSFQEEELEGALVSSFPDDVPLYPGDVVSSIAALSEVTEQPEWNATMTTGDPFDAVDSAIRSDYTSDGWQIRSEMDHLGGYLLVAGKDNYTVSITYNDMQGPGITINYGVSS